MADDIDHADEPLHAVVSEQPQPRAVEDDPCDEPERGRVTALIGAEFLGDKPPANQPKRYASDNNRFFVNVMTAFAAISAAVFSGWQAHETRLARLESNRAWVTETSVIMSSELVVGNVFAPEIVFVNSGPSPALDGKPNFYLHVEPWGSSYNYPTTSFVPSFSFLLAGPQVAKIENNSFTVIGPNVQAFIPASMPL